MVSENPEPASAVPQSASTSSLGPYLTLNHLPPARLPFHPILAATSTSTTPASPKPTHPPIRTFLRALLTESHALALSIDNIRAFRSTSTTISPPATAQVEQLRSCSPFSSSSSLLGSGAPWFARRSVHADDGGVLGSAAWSEFEAGLRVCHCEREAEFTEAIFDCVRVCGWEVGEGGEEERSKDGGLEGWGDVTMEVYEMCHKLPTPLAPRAFPILVVTATKGPDEFIVAQVPIDLKGVSSAMYSTGSNTREGDSALKRKSAVLGTYTSVERVRRLGNGQIEWVMATSSDAKGSLPAWVQNAGIPGAIAKDVGFFMKWTAEQRGKT